MVGWLVEKNWSRLGFWNLFLFNVIGGIVVVYVIGIPWLAVVANMEFGKAIVGSAVFIPGDVAKAVVAAVALDDLAAARLVNAARDQLFRDIERRETKASSGHTR